MFNAAVPTPWLATRSTDAKQFIHLIASSANLKQGKSKFRNVIKLGGINHQDCCAMLARPPSGLSPALARRSVLVTLSGCCPR